MECSIDYLLNDDMQDNGEVDPGLSVQDCVKFIRECGYFFLATAFEDKPKLRPMGMIYSDDKALYIATDKRKNVYTDLTNNPQVELAGYNLNTRKWIRISGRMQVESSIKVKEDMMLVYPMIKQEYIGEEEVYLAIFKLVIDNVTIY